jgi:hypothetical protein
MEEMEEMEEVEEEEEEEEEDEAGERRSKDHMGVFRKVCQENKGGEG